MEIVRHDLYCSESVDLTLVFERDLSDEEIARLKQLLPKWVQEQVKAENYTQVWQPRLSLENADNRREICVDSDWFPDEWFEPLAHALERDFPTLRRLDIGTDFEPPYRDDKAFISVPRKLVQFEDGSNAEVQPFEIAKYPVSVEQFSRFAEQTGYVTVAEKRNDEYTFREGPGDNAIAMQKRLPTPAQWLCYLDATAYCNWAGVRLPTEAEWVAASVIDDNVRNDNEVSRWRSEVGADPMSCPAALAMIDEEITGAIVEGDRISVVLRQGPYLARTRQDVSAPYYRHLVSLSYYEMTQFRVCQLNTAAR
jgi:hypothetical protein